MAAARRWWIGGAVLAVTPIPAMALALTLAAPLVPFLILVLLAVAAVRSHGRASASIVRAWALTLWLALVGPAFLVLGLVFDPPGYGVVDGPLGLLLSVALFVSAISISALLALAAILIARRLLL